MNRIVRIIFGSKQQQMPKQSAARTGKNTKMTIEESIRRYEQLCAK